MSTSTFKCPDCNKVCKTKAALTLHYKSHQDMHQKEEQLTKVMEEEKKSTQQQLKEVVQQLEQLKIDISSRIQAQIDAIQRLL